MADAISSLAGFAGASGAKLQLETERAELAAGKAKRLAGEGRKNDTAALNPKRLEEIDQAATQFEGLLLKQMFSSMWTSVPKDGILSGSREEEMYRDMLNDTLAEAASKTQSLGIKEVVRRELMRREKT